MILTLCMRCGKMWDNENVYGYRFCDSCFPEVEDDLDGAELAYAMLNPQWKLWWDKFFDKEEMN